MSDPFLSNAGPDRFLFGTFDTENDPPLFHGTVIFGTDLVFDPDTGLPVSGRIDRIELQTRSEVEVIETHAVHDDIAASVSSLNDAFQTADAPWFDPAIFAGTDQMTGGDFTLGEDSLSLATGDVLTAQDIFDIFMAGASQAGKATVIDTGDGVSMTLLNADLATLSIDDFQSGVERWADDGADSADPVVESPVADAELQTVFPLPNEIDLAGSDDLLDGTIAKFSVDGQGPQNIALLDEEEDFLLGFL